MDLFMQDRLDLRSILGLDDRFRRPERTIIHPLQFFENFGVSVCYFTIDNKTVRNIFLDTRKMFI